jgi:NAD(P)-dependent dehydrogenase (short-subunit alcohol dehydrogenase family)
VRLYEADFERLDDVRNVARQLTDDLERIDVLHNNAGITMLRREETVDGHEKTFAVNHLAPFLLTNLLLPRVLETPGARIVNVASDAHRFARFDIDDLQSTKRFSAMRVYGASKLANILFTNEFSQRLEGKDVRWIGNITVPGRSYHLDFCHQVPESGQHLLAGSK